MYFKSFVVLRLPDSSHCEALLELSLEEGADALSDHRAEPPGVTQMRTMGLAEPAAHWPNSLIYPIPGSGAVLMAIRHYERVLPRQAVLDKLKAAIAALEENEGRHVTAKESRQLAEKITIEMMPQAFIQHKTTPFIIDGKYIYVSHTAGKIVEDIAAVLRGAFGSFPARRMVCELDGVSMMTSMLRSCDTQSHQTVIGEEDLVDQEQFTFGTSAHILHHDGEYRVKDIDLLSDQAVREVMEEGATVHRLGLIYLEQVSFVLDGDLAFRSVKTLDTYNERREEVDPELEDYRVLLFDADMLLWLSTVRDLRNAVADTFGGERDPESADKTEQFANCGQNADTEPSTDDFDL